MANDTLTITLTGRPPVTVKKEAWPVLASAAHEDWDGQYDFQANRKLSARLTVRQHADGRAIAYAVYDYETHFQSERSYEYRAGYLLEGNASSETIIVTIERLATYMDRHVRPAHFPFRGGFAKLAAEAIADLPAEVLE